MKTNRLLLIILLIGGINLTVQAQSPTTAYDFNMNDCNGKCIICLLNWIPGMWW
jgi:hypothetical protein